MFQAAETVQLDPDRLSFTGCFQILKCRLPECDSSTPQSFEDWYQALLWEVQKERRDDRRDRVNPRVIKRKMSKWPKKRPCHRRSTTAALEENLSAVCGYASLIGIGARPQLSRKANRRNPPGVARWIAAGRRASAGSGNDPRAASPPPVAQTRECGSAAHHQ